MLKTAALALLLLTEAQAINLNAKNQGKHDFIKGMRQSQKIHGKLPRKLTHDRLIAKSVHNPGLRSSDFKEPVSTKSIKETSIPTTDKISQEPSNRKLWSWTEWYNYITNRAPDDEEMVESEGMNETENQGNQGNQGSWWNWNGWSSNVNGTEGDVTDDMWSTGYNETAAIMESLADFSVKYAGCSSLTSFTSSNDDGSSPFNNQNFVTYRLCPSESCADDSWNGCKATYGEYLMNLEDFLQVQQDYIEEEFEYYCTFCEYCIYYNTYFSANGTSCSQTEACENYNDYCSDEAIQQAEDDAAFSLEDFFECKEIDIWGDDDDDEEDNGNNVTTADDLNFDDQYNMYFNNQGKAYIGSHCNEGIIQIGLFADDQCLQYVGNEIDFFNATGYEVEASAVEDMYVPDGCLACNGDNIKTSGYWFPGSAMEEDEYQEEVEQEEIYISEICYNMYSDSAKCHTNYAADNNETLELSDSELLNQDVTCNFIEDVLKGYVDEDGFVYNHGFKNSTFLNNYFAFFGADDMETEVTAAQVAGLIVTGTATAAMVAAAFHMRRKIEGPDFKEGLITNDAAISA